MWEKIVDLAISNGLWAVMFLGLLVYLLKDSRTREIKYQNTIASLNKSLNIVEDIKDDVLRIKNKMFNKQK